MNRAIDHRHDDYPHRLRGLDRVPETLHWRGRLDRAERRVAVVGARAASGGGLERASLIAQTVAHAGGTIYSGGAIGIDGAAHRGALAARGRTVAVLASGFDHLYPARHKPLFDDILAAGGALASGHPPSTPPRRYQFVHRNHLLAALCDAVVVVEADRGSGSLYTAAAALECSRVLLAMPGSPGCEALIAQGAIELDDPTTILESAFGPRRVAAAPELSASEAAVLSMLGGEPKSAHELAGAGSTALDVAEIERALTTLELARLAMATPGRAYVCSALGEAARQ